MAMISVQTTVHTDSHLEAKNFRGKHTHKVMETLVIDSQSCSYPLRYLIHPKIIVERQEIGIASVQ
jgi:hypothetical protein